MQITTDKKIVYFLPYFSIDEEIRVGNIALWPFHAMKEELINDAAIRAQLEKIFACYVNRDGDATQSITIASIGEPEFVPFSGSELENVDSAVKILAFASMMKNQFGFQYRNSENFHVYWQEFVPGEETVSIRYRFRRNAYGGYVHSLGPYKFDQVKFIQPDSVLVTGATELDQRMLAALEKVLANKGIDTGADRILRSLEWFYFSHFDLRDIPDTAAVVMMATALESLLGLSYYRKTYEFATKVENFLVNKAGGFINKIASQPTSRLIRGKSHHYTNAGWWAVDFYGLRSTIVHGGTSNLVYEGKSQLEIADLVFIEALKRELEEKNLFTYVSEDEEFRNAIYKHVGF